MDTTFDRGADMATETGGMREERWRGRPVLGRLLRLAIVLVPIAVSVAMGAVVGVAVVAVVVIAKFGPLINTPRSAHGVLIAGMIALPAFIGAVAGYMSRRAS